MKTGIVCTERSVPEMPKEKKQSIPAGKVHKGKIKPVSSSRMADLLSNSGGVSFFGFEADKTSDDVHQLDQEEEEKFTDDLDSRFQVVMKLLNKKDSQTKLKALHEFSTLCQTESKETVFGSRRLWVVMYNRLSLDTDHCVREACHGAMKHFVSKVKREFAPSLKMVIGYWVCGMSDPNLAVSVSACDAFDVAFSKEKQVEVYKFAFSDILSHVSELLSTTNLVLGRRFSSDNERKLYLELLALQGLMCFHRLIKSTPIEIIGQHIQEVNSVWTNEKLWTLVKHECTNVRASIYKICPEIITIHKNLDNRPAIAAIFNSIEERDPLVVPHLWCAVVAIVVHFKAWYEYIDTSTALIKGFEALLITGCHGSITKTYPLLLPLLQNIYPQLKSVDSKFGAKIFGNLVLGLSNEITRRHPSDVDCFYATFGDICAYMFVSHADDVNKSSFISSMSELLQNSICHFMRSSTAPTLCGNLLRKLLLLPLPENISVGVVTAFDTVLVEAVSSDCNSKQGSTVERAWGCLHAVLEGHKEYNEESHLVNTLPVMKALKSTLLNLCTKCFSIGVEKRSNPHMKLFAAAMKLSYKLELGLPELVAPVLCMSSTAKSDDSSVSSLFVLLSSTHEKFCTMNDTSLMDYTDSLIESMVWIAISGKSHDAAIEMITDFCDLYPITLPVFFCKLLDSPLRHGAVSKLLPIIVDSKNLPKCDNPISYDILHKVITCQEEWVPVQMAQQLLGNVSTLSVNVLKQLNCEELPADKLWYFALLSDANSQSVTPDLVPKVEDLLTYLTTLLFCPQGDEVADKSLKKCFSHLLGLCHHCSDAHANVFTSVCSTLWSAIQSLDMERFCDFAILFADLVRNIPDVFFFDVFSSLLDDCEPLPYLSPLAAEKFAKGEMLLFSNTIGISSQFPQSYRKSLLMAYALADGLAVGLIISDEKLKQISHVLNILSYGCHWEKFGFAKTKGDERCNCVFQDGIHSILMELSNNQCHEEVLKELFHLSNIEGGIKTWSFGCILQCYFMFEDLDTTCVQGLLSSLLKLSSTPTFQSILKVLKEFGIVQDLPPLTLPTEHSDAQELASVIGRVAVQLRVFHSSQDIDLSQSLILLLAQLQERQDFMKWDVKMSDLSDYNRDILLSVLFLVEDLVLETCMPVAAWDFILCLLVMCCQSLVNEDHKNVNLMLLYCNVLRLCQRIDSFFSSTSDEGPQAQEWIEFFKPAIMDVLNPLCEQLLQSPLQWNKCESIFLCDFCQLCIKWSEDMKTPCTLGLPCLARLLTNENHCFQVMGSLLLSRYDFHFDEQMDNTAELIKDVKLFVGEVVTNIKDSLLPNLAHWGISVKDSLLSQPASSHASSALLLLWAGVIEIAEKAPIEVKVEIQGIIKETKTFDSLMQCICLYLSPNYTQLTMDLQYPTVTLEPDEHQLACFVDWKIAQQFPVMLRQWYLALSRQDAQEFQKFISQSVSSLLRRNQLKALQEAAGHYGDNMEVRVFSEVSEVSVTYKIEDVSVELIVLLPEDYPLHPPTVREGKRVRVEASQWRKWMLQLHIFLTKQNGSLHDGLLLWKSNLDKHFAGVQECMICFSIIHTSNYSLPKLACKTCNHEFHSVCLYKWFHTSGKSTCPLCRNFF